MKAFLALLLFLAAASSALDIPSTCTLVCADLQPYCLQACSEFAFKRRLPFYGLPYARVTERFNMGLLSEQVTGSDAPNKVSKQALYFTTREGKLYYYNNKTASFNTVFNMARHSEVDFDNDKGLYNVAFHPMFSTNLLFYLYYSSPAPIDAVMTFVVRNKRGKEPTTIQVRVDHYNVISEFQIVGDSAQLKRVLRRIPQIEPRRSGGWLSAAVKENWDYWSENPLYYSVGGNSNESVVFGQEMSYLSSIGRFDASNISKANDLWASGIASPLSCSATVLKSDHIFCLIQLKNNTRAIYDLRKDMNAGSDEYVEACRGLECEHAEWKNEDRSPSVVFPPSECPVTSVMLYTGYLLKSAYRTNLFISRDACYSPETAQFRPAEILRLVKNSTSGDWYTNVFPCDFEDDFLVNTTLIGADKSNLFLLSGVSVRSGRTTFYEIDPVRAHKDHV